MKLANSKEKEILKEARNKKSLTFMGRSIRITADLSTETWQARKGWQGIFRVLNEKNMQPRILYPARLSFRIEGEIKSFQGKQEQKEYVTTKPALQDTYSLKIKGWRTMYHSNGPQKKAGVAILILDKAYPKDCSKR